MSIRASLLSFMLRRTMKKTIAAAEDMTSLKEEMARAAGLGPKLPDDANVEPVTVGDVPCEWVGADSEYAMLYLHGGGYVFGGLDSHRDLAWRLSVAAGMRVLVVDYRLAPEHPFPAALEDATACYRWLVDQGYTGDRLAIAGDSAGGGLAVATMMNARGLGMPMPHSAVLLSPWVDLSLSGDSIKLNAEADAMLPASGLQKFADAYLGDRDPRAPFASPLFGDLSGVPPMLIIVGSTEVLLSDSKRLADKVREAGGEAQLDVWPKMPHVFPVFAGRVPEGKQAIEKIGSFLKQRVTASAAD